MVFKDRWKIPRERVLAMREIWTKEGAEFHGQFVDFDPIWCWPKLALAGSQSMGRMICRLVSKPFAQRLPKSGAPRMSLI